jgi:ABC-type amino acid transport substrate-binding protein
LLNFIRKLLLITTIIFSCVFAIAADAKPESAVDTSHFDDKVVVNIGSIAAAENEEIINIGYIAGDSPASYYIDGRRSGIAVELFEQITDKLKLNVNFHSYLSHEKAIQDLSDNKISALLGAFVHDPKYENMNIIHSPAFFIDEDIIIAPVSELSFVAVYEMIWTPLLQKTLLFSFLASIIFWLLLFLFEGSRHPDLKNRNIFEKLTYTFFQIWACFLRDLLYDPVTNAGRILMSMWMFFSIIMITIATSIMTSTIILLNTKHNNLVSHVNDLHYQNVGFLGGHHSSEYSISVVGGHTKPYEYIGNLLMDLSANKNIDYGVVSKTTLSDYFLYKPYYKKDIIISTVAVGYEGWVLLYNKDFSAVDKINSELVHLVERGEFYGICAKHISHPEHCLVM